MRITWANVECVRLSHQCNIVYQILAKQQILVTALKELLSYSWNEINYAKTWIFFKKRLWVYSKGQWSIKLKF